MKRTLTLKSETLTSLDPGTLAAVGGAGEVHVLTPQCPTYPPLDCLTWSPGCSVFCTV